MLQDSKEKPVTFGRPIKSSGYCASEPWSVEQARKAKMKQQLKKSKELPRMKEYNLASPPPMIPLVKTNETLLKSQLHSGVVTSLGFDAAGAFLVSSSGDTTISMLKLPVVKHLGAAYVARGHKSMVNGVDVSLSLQNPLVLSASFDGFIGLWRPTKRDTPYILHDAGKEVKTVRFGYMDKFASFSCGNSVSIGTFSVDDGGGDLDRKRNHSKFSVVHTIVTGSQQVTDYDWINSFLSTIIVWCGSNKQIGVRDIAAERDVRVIDDAHSRPIHSLELLRSSRYANVGTEALHLFASASMDKTVRVWDIRQSSPVRQLSQHVNSSVRVGMSFSPCGKFLVVGSEDRSAYVYSLSDGSVLSKLPAPDVVTSVRFHPLECSLVALGCANGNVQFFGVK
jgi:WD40 repeat protein